MGLNPVIKTVHTLLVEACLSRLRLRSRITRKAMELQGENGPPVGTREEQKANLIIGIDVSKGESQGQAFLDKNRPYGTSFRFSHDKKGLEFLLEG